MITCWSPISSLSDCFQMIHPHLHLPETEGFSMFCSVWKDAEESFVILLKNNGYGDFMLSYQSLKSFTYGYLSFPIFSNSFILSPLSRQIKLKQIPLILHLSYKQYLYYIFELKILLKERMLQSLC